MVDSASDLECTRRPRAYFGPCISPSIERARASREHKPALVVTLKPEPATATAATLYAPATPAEIRNYDGLIEAFRARANELQISRATIDHIAGLPDGLSSKILSLNHLRRIGMQTLGVFLDTLGLKLVAVRDEAALSRNRPRYVKRNASQVRQQPGKPKVGSRSRAKRKAAR